MAPFPKTNPARRNARVGPLILPADGRQGPPPEWPVPDGAEPAEWEAWARLWSTPQAAAWERMGAGAVLVVARYTRLLVQSLQTGASAQTLAEARQLEDRLGLNPRSMRGLLWSIASDEIAERRAESAESAEPTPRRQIKAV